MNKMDRFHASSMTRSKAGPKGVFLQLLPDWTPSKQPRFARFNVLIKVARGAFLTECSRIELHLLDSVGNLIGIREATHDPVVKPIQGPGWRRIAGRILPVEDTVSQAEAVLGTVRSARVSRRDAKHPLLLVAVPDQVGVAGEPHLWWRFFNCTADPIPVKRIFGTSLLWVDDRAFHPQSPYNGPSLLPSGRALSGLWSLDDIDPSAAAGRHRFTLEMLGERSTDIEPLWNRATL